MNVSISKLFLVFVYAGHQVPSSSVVSEEAVDPEFQAYQEHQATAAKLSFAEEARTLVETGRCKQHWDYALPQAPFTNISEYCAESLQHP